jgi:hypothetical protein
LWDKVRHFLSLLPDTYKDANDEEHVGKQTLLSADIVLIDRSGFLQVAAKDKAKVAAQLA